MQILYHRQQNIALQTVCGRIIKHIRILSPGENMSVFRLCAALCLSGLLFGCATRPVAVVEKEHFVLMTKSMGKELQARRLLDKDGSYVPSLSFVAFRDYGGAIFNRLSPEFILRDAGFVYPETTFSALARPGTRVDKRPNGFTIEDVMRKIDVNMVAVADWNYDGENEWIVSCLVEPKRGGRTRTYYVLVPPPRNDKEPLSGTVAAVYECFGLACNIYVRDSRVIERAAANPLAPPTVVQDLVPGLQPVTEPPKKLPPDKRSGGVEERAL
jgi:hypothetical protein